MTTQSNKNIFTIIIIAAIGLFVFAIYWKQNNNSNAEVVNVKPKPLKTKLVKPKNNKDLSFLDDSDDSIIARDKAEDDYANQPAQRKKLSNILQLNLMYKTPESVMESVVYYQEHDNHEKVDELINFLLERFPEYDIPDDI